MNTVSIDSDPLPPHEVKDGAWQPRPIAVPLTLKKIHNPGGLMNGAGVYLLPMTNQWCAFDFASKDWVEPNGMGRVADVEFLVEWDGKPPVGSRLCKLKMRFPGRGAGGYFAPTVTESELPYQYEANGNNPFKTEEITVVNRDGDPHFTKVNFREDAELIVRCRCLFNDDELVAANYGSIRGLKVSPSWNSNPTIRFAYVFNPKANDTNLELQR